MMVGTGRVPALRGDAYSVLVHTLGGADPRRMENGAGVYLLSLSFLMHITWVPTSRG